MKINVSYKKSSDGKILVRLRILDGGDYPSTLIFSRYDDYPSNDGYVLSAKHQSLLECKLDSVKEAVEWVEKEISTLRQHLQRWREIDVPEETTYII